MAVVGSSPRVIEDGRPVSHVAKELGVSRQCAHRWVARLRAEGEAGRRERSSRPHHCPRRSPSEVEQLVRQLRREHRRGQAWIGPELDLAPRTVSAILRRHRVPYLRECDQLTGEVIRSSKTTAVRQEHDHRGSLVHMDVKKLARIHDGGGWKAHGGFPPLTTDKHPTPEVTDDAGASISSPTFKASQAEMAAEALR